MGRSAFMWSLALVVGLAASAQAQTEEALEQAAVELGASEFSKRQAATELLWRAGPAAKEILERSARSSDPEIRARATALLNQLRLGIRPETPAEVTALIDQFRFAGTPTQRRQALAELQTKGHWQAILTLIRGERDPETRKNLATAMLAEAGKLVRPLVERGQFDDAEEVLELVAVNEPGISQWTAFLILTGRLDQALSEAKQRVETEPSAEAWQKLAYLARARGDLADSRSAAERTGDLYLQTNLFAEAGLWSEAAKTTADLLKSSERRVEALAFAATFNRLAGNQEEYERHVQSLVEAASVNDLVENPPAANAQRMFGRASTGVNTQSAWTAAEALLVNERTEEGLALLKKINPRFAHAMLWRQHRHREALDFVKVPQAGPLDRAWFDALPAPAGDVNSQQENRFLLGLQVTRQLRELGLNEPMLQALETLRGLSPTTNDRGRRLSLVAALQWQLGRYDDMARDAERAMAAGSVRIALFNAIVAKNAGLAEFWFEDLKANRWPNDLPKAFITAIGMSAANPPQGMLPVDWKDLVAAAQTRIGKQRTPDRAQRLAVLGQTCEIRGDRELAMKLFQEAAQLDGRLALREADLALSQQDWKQAAVAYKRSADSTSGDAVSLYLYGYCLVNSGEDAAGQKQMLLAAVTALAPEVRLVLAAGLQERKLHAEVERQVQLVRRTALPDSPAAATAAQFFANLAQKDRPEEAAEAWQQLLLHVLNTSGSFPEIDHYLRFPHLLHKARGVAAASAGKPEEAAKEFEVCERLLPGDVNLAVDVAPLLDQRGLKELADSLVKRSVLSHQTIVDEFSQSATNWNNAAWALARGQRQLDRALEMAEKAVGLLPNESSYQDTLAEVHFQRGNRDAAVAAAKRAAELSPFSPLFARRLAHFQHDELKSLDAGEAD